ncbi:hypothetical protein JW824_11650 [bacterium]|nr:hypothetical protein [bacterium]
MRQNRYKSEEGFLSAFLIIFLVTLGLMGAGAFVLVNSEGINMVNQVQLLQSGYAADGAVYYGIRALRQYTFTSPTTMTIGGAYVTLSTSRTGERIFLDVTADMSNVQNDLQIQIRVDTLRNAAVFSTNDVNNDIVTEDDDGNTDMDYLIVNTDSLPTIDRTALENTAISQGWHRTESTFTPADGYPTGSFWNSPGVPNVIWVENDIWVSSAITIYGIYLVDGDVFTDDQGQVQGIFYVPNTSSTIYLNRQSDTFDQIVGGIITNGYISSWGLGAVVTVQNNRTFMAAFDSYVDNPDYVFAHVFSWNYM